MPETAAQPHHGAAMAPDHAAVRRQSIAVESGADYLFGWYHSAPAADARDCAALICYPLGYEYIHSHRALRHLADQLARAGIPALRFDYHGTGDAPGDVLEPERVERWLQDIAAAVEHLRALSGRGKICLIGLRMGATLAALSANSADYLVLWNPCVRGRHYVREMQALARASQDGASSNDWIESAGFMLSAQTAERLKSIDLLQWEWPQQVRVLVAGRDDLAPDTALADHLNASGVQTQSLALPGYEAMLAEPQFTVVPETALSSIVAWLCTHTESSAAVSAREIDIPSLTFTYTPTYPAAAAVALNETACRFGADNALFGILTRPITTSSDQPAVILLNSGSVHHVGPNRLYTTLARELAARGHICLRMDMQGLGDSIARGATRENHPYPASAVSDADSAMAFLSATHHCSRFVLLGLCSGAHTAFHAGIELAERNIADLILLNPLTFHWVEGMSLATTQHFQDVAHYKKAARSMDRWLKLLRGQVDLRHIAGVIGSQMKVRARSVWDSLRERVFGIDTTPLSADLKKLYALKRPVSLFVGEHDPSYDVLMAEARRVAQQGLERRQLRVQFIGGADHTFSQQAPRSELIRRLVAHLQDTG